MFKHMLRYLVCCCSLLTATPSPLELLFEEANLEALQASIDNLSLDEQVALLKAATHYRSHALPFHTRGGDLPCSLSSDLPAASLTEEPVADANYKHKYTALIVTNGKVFNPGLPSFFEGSSSKAWGWCATASIAALTSLALSTLMCAYSHSEASSEKTHPSFGERCLTLAIPLACGLLVLGLAPLITKKMGERHEQKALELFIQHWLYLRTLFDWPLQHLTIFDRLHKEYQSGTLHWAQAREFVHALRSNTGR